MRKVEVVVLCEDAQHESFIVRYLKKLGLNRSQLRIRPYPGGAGSGEQWVRERYPGEVAEQRRRANHTSATLVAITDADTLTVEERARRLDGALCAAGHLRRRDGERIALIIPRRNIESWLHFAEASEIDEATDFKPRYRGDKEACRAATNVALKVCRANGANADERQAPPSLTAACRELRRVVPS